MFELYLIHENAPLFVRIFVSRLCCDNWS